MWNRNKLVIPVINRRQSYNSTQIHRATSWLVSQSDPKVFIFFPKKNYTFRKHKELHSREKEKHKGRRWKVLDETKDLKGKFRISLNMCTTSLMLLRIFCKQDFNIHFSLTLKKLTHKKSETASIKYKLFLIKSNVHSNPCSLQSAFTYNISSNTTALLGSESNLWTPLYRCWMRDLPSYHLWLVEPPTPIMWHQIPGSLHTTLCLLIPHQKVTKLSCLPHLHKFITNIVKTSIN